MSSTIAVAYELGAGRKKDAIQYSYIARVMAIIIALLICAFTFTHMDDIADLFTMMMKYMVLFINSLDMAYSFPLSMPSVLHYKVY